MIELNRDEFMEVLKENERAKIMLIVTHLMRTTEYSRNSASILTSGIVRSIVDNVAKTFRGKLRLYLSIEGRGELTYLLSIQ